jgi:hypothetical protein
MLCVKVLLMCLLNLARNVCLHVATTVHGQLLLRTRRMHSHASNQGVRQVPSFTCVLQAKLSAALREYRLLHGAHVRHPGALIYPSSLRYLAVFVLGLLKSTAFRCVRVEDVGNKTLKSKPCGALRQKGSEWMHGWQATRWFCFSCIAVALEPAVAMPRF